MQFDLPVAHLYNKLNTEIGSLLVVSLSMLDDHHQAIGVTREPYTQIHSITGSSNGRERARLGREGGWGERGLGREGARLRREGGERRGGGYINFHQALCYL